MNKEILEPKKEYVKYLDEVEQVASSFFDNLKNTSKINETENEQECIKYYDLDKKASSENKLISKYKTKIGLLIALIAIVVIACIALYNNEEVSNYHTLIIVLTIIISFVSILLIVKLYKKLKISNESFSKLIIERDKVKERAYDSISDLLIKFDYELPLELIKKACPILELDKEFDIRKYSYMRSKYGLLDIKDKNRSIFHCLSGSITGNPFFYQKIYETYMLDEVYTGSLIISWQENIRDSEGKVTTVTRTETLTASVTRPKPHYSFETSLIYANDAAPNLNFSRKPTGLSGKSDEQIEKYVKKYTKKLERKENKDIKNDNSDFQLMGNEEFDCIFNAINRDNEREFRLLFTPLAQKNMIDLIKDPKPFGDDFSFKKRGCINIIKSIHSQTSDLYLDPNNYYSFDLTLVKSNLINYTKDLFTNIYFDIAPLISIPLYQQNKPREYIYDKEFLDNYNFTTYEDESIANKFNKDLFKPDGADTPSILKVSGIKKEGKSDIVNVKSYAFYKRPGFTTVPVMGGDGRMHAVPVDYIDYIPISKSTFMTMYHTNLNKQEFNSIKNSSDFMNLLSQANSKGFICQKGILALITDNIYNSSVVNYINKIINK